MDEIDEILEEGKLMPVFNFLVQVEIDGNKVLKTTVIEVASSAEKIPVRDGLAVETGIAAVGETAEEIPVNGLIFETEGVPALVGESEVEGVTEEKGDPPADREPTPKEEITPEMAVALLVEKATEAGVFITEDPGPAGETVKRVPDNPVAKEEGDGSAEEAEVTAAVEKVREALALMESSPGEMTHPEAVAKVDVLASAAASGEDVEGSTITPELAANCIEQVTAKAKEGMATCAFNQPDADALEVVSQDVAVAAEEGAAAGVSDKKLFEAVGLKFVEKPAVGENIASGEVVEISFTETPSTDVVDEAAE